MQAWGPEAFLKTDSSTCTFPAKFVKFLRESRMKTICEPLTIHVKDTADEAYLESSQTYMMKFFGENSYCHGSKYASEPQK